jgi:membrane protein
MKLPPNLDLMHLLRLSVVTFGRALTRLWGRDVMLYTGGVSFFVMLAIFPGVAIAVGVYSLLSDPNHVALQADMLARLMPAAPRLILQGELMRLAHAPPVTTSVQSVLALVIGGYASHRGFKALLAGLSFIHDEEHQRGFVSFNLLALGVLIATFVLLAVVSTLFLGLRILADGFDLHPLRGLFWLYSEWTWGTVGMTLGMSLIYRFAMSRETVDWRASILGGAAAAMLCLGASWGIAIYVDQIAHLGATYGSIATVIVFLIWLSWTVNALFFGGALATEVEIAIDTAKLTASPPQS